MNRLQEELRRLYGATATDGDDPAPAPSLSAADSQVRAMAFQLVRPAAWHELSKLWRGVQAELDLPAPAIAVSGAGYQLWFSLQQPVERSRAQGFLLRLQERFLPDVAPDRVSTWPGAQPASSQPAGIALPPVQLGAERWSAFIAADLAPVFADEPWLDQPPGIEAQGELLSRLVPIDPEAFERALARLDGTQQPVSTPPSSPAPAAGSRGEGPAATAAQDAATEPQAFLLEVMRNPDAGLALRVQAAIALLPYRHRPA